MDPHDQSVGPDPLEGAPHQTGRPLFCSVDMIDAKDTYRLIPSG